MKLNPKQMRKALIVCRQHIKISRGSWWNDRDLCDLMTKHINPALGLDPWDDNWLTRGEANRTPTIQKCWTAKGHRY